MQNNLAREWGREEGCSLLQILDEKYQNLALLLVGLRGKGGGKFHR